LAFIATPANFSANAHGYQHHVLDCILRQVMEDEQHGSTQSPDIDYFFYERFDKSVPSTKGRFHQWSQVKSQRLRSRKRSLRDYMKPVRGLVVRAFAL